MTFLEPTSMVKISEIFLPPIRATIQSKSMITKFVEIAQNNPKILPITKLGKINEKLYAINNFNLIKACKIANLPVIPSCIIECESITDMIIAHFHESINEEPLNTLSIFDVIDFLAEKGFDKKQAVQKLWLDNTQYEKLVQLQESHISNKALEDLQKIIDLLSERNITPSLLQIPVYVILKLCKITDESTQLQLVSKIGTMVSSIPDGKFAWPTPEQIDTLGILVKDYTDNYVHQEDTREETSKDTFSTKTRTKKFDSIPKLEEFLKKLDSKDGIKLILTWSYQ